jgi:hypothetical protein
MGSGYRAYYDERTRAFLKERWNTPLGEQVRQEVFRGIVDSVDLRFILERYTLQTRIYGAWFGAEYYPHEHMSEGEFWVLHGNDLRGFFFNEVNDYRRTASLDKMCLDYAIFPRGTNLSGVNLEMTSLEGAVFYECSLVGTCFAGAGGAGAKFEKSDMRDVLLWDARFEGPNLKGCDLRGAYLEGCDLQDPALDFRTRFDESIVRQWENRRIDDLEAARIYRQLADAHHSHRFYGRADTYYVAERRMAREQVRVELRENRRLAPKLHSMLRLAADYVFRMPYSGTGSARQR